MKIKLGNSWFIPMKGYPLVIELSEADKENIKNMHPKATKYAVFADDEDMTTEQKLAMMD